MKHILILLTCIISLAASLHSADLKSQIGQRGDAAWENLLKNPRDGYLIDPPLSAHTIASDFDQYMGNLMLFPEFSFDDFMTDRNGEKYYYYGEKESDGFFVIKYDNRITEMLRKYSYAMGPVGEESWELLGSIEEVYSWWGDIVLMDIKAVRIRSRATVILEDGDLNFVAQDLIDRFMDEKAAAGLGDLPQNLTSIPSGLDPKTVADLYFHIASKEQNKEVWLELLSPYNFYNGKPERRVDSWWNGLTKPDRTFFYVRTATDEAKTKKYFYQIRENGNDVGSPKPITIVLEDNEWKVKSGI